MESKYCKAIDFCLNFSKDDIKKVLPDILEEFIHQYGEEYRDVIISAGNSVKWILYNNAFNLIMCFDELENKLLKEISQNFFESLGLVGIRTMDDLKNSKKGNPYVLKIIEIFDSRNVSSFESYKCMMVLNNPIKSYLLESLSNCEEKETAMIRSCISKLEEMTLEYNNIHEKYEYFFKTTSELKHKYQEFISNLNSNFIKSIEFLLSEKDKKYISENIPFDICNLDANCNLFSYNSQYGIFQSEIFNPNISIDKKRKILNYLGCDYKEEDLLDYNKFLNSINNKYFTVSSINKLPYHVLQGLIEGKYSNLDIYYYMGLVTRSYYILKKQYEKDKTFFQMTDKKMIKNIKNEHYEGTDPFSNVNNLSSLISYIKSKFKTYSEIKRIFDSLINKSYYVSAFIIYFTITIYGQSKTDKMIFLDRSSEDSFFNHGIIIHEVHELGHIVSQTVYSEKYENIYEITNHYVILKVVENLYDKEKISYGDIFSYSKLNSLYYKLFFFLEPFKEYIHLFKEMNMSGNLSILEDFMGKENLEDYNNLLNEARKLIELGSIDEMSDIHARLEEIVKQVFEYNESAKKKEIH